MLIPAIVFIVLFSGISGAYWFFVLRHEQDVAGTIRRRLRSPRTAKRSAKVGNLVAHQQSMSAIRPLDAFLSSQQSWSQRAQVLIEEAGVQMTVGTLVLSSAVAAMLAFAVVQRLAGVGLLGVPAALLAAFIPTQILRFMRTRRLRTFEDQFPEALDLLARSLRAGHAFTTGIEMVAAELPKPIGSEFRLLFDRQNYGMAVADALKSFAQRVPVLDARLFVTAVLVQRESGGNLSEVLDNLSSVIRDRHRVKRQMRVLSTHSRMTGTVLIALPPAVALLLLMTSPEHMNAMLNTTLGIQMLIGAAALQVFGTLVIRKIVNVEY